MTDAYASFLEGKAQTAPACGFEPDLGRFPTAMKPFQSDLTGWGLRRGRAALWEGTGLGKTLQELTWGREVSHETKRPVLIFAPLAVAEQTVAEAEKFNVDGAAWLIARAAVLAIAGQRGREKAGEAAYLIADECSVAGGGA